MGKRSSAAAKTVCVTMLGSFRLQVGDNVITDEEGRSQKLWSVLCYLIAHRGRSVPQAEFIEMFWPEEDNANPVSALKTLLYRARLLLDPLFEKDLPCILSQRGAYSWNPAIACEVDADWFGELCREAGDRALPEERRMDLYRQAVALYHGDYLFKLSGQMWVVPLSARYHAMYLEAVKAYAALLERAQKFAEMEELCTRASALDALDEGLHTLTVRALLRQGKNAAALSRYEKATDLLYRNLGVRPSQELRGLYTEIMAVEEGLETDLEVIQEGLRETAARPGAFVCEYGFFKEAYRLEARRARRNGNCVHVALLTVSLPDGGVPPLGVLGVTMDQLLEILLHNLRRGDVVSKYSGAQYVVMLPSANLEDSTMVMERVVAAFYRQHRRNFLKIFYKLRELELA
ncbi:Bacterial transcriptional activator domain protein [uncultured Eubacteriales bacterium]|uniref:Bacterial transcriptional activator domain protein n=1 Tax=uncultured Eubacteriales bacterium TaxID=172733 RepID=A0A212IV99_9FIRM|nr:Bacterial transcriptional activator domain protein [uncultured Eubacteriales bacterium]